MNKLGETTLDRLIEYVIGDTGHTVQRDLRKLVTLFNRYGFSDGLKVAMVIQSWMASPR
jgi:hypothetical protein